MKIFVSEYTELGPAIAQHLIPGQDVFVNYQIAIARDDDSITISQKITLTAADEFDADLEVEPEISSCSPAECHRNFLKKLLPVMRRRIIETEKENNA